MSCTNLALSVGLARYPSQLAQSIAVWDFFVFFHAFCMCVYVYLMLVDFFLHVDFSGSIHTSDLKMGTPVATLRGTRHSMVSMVTGLPSVSLL